MRTVDAFFKNASVQKKLALVSCEWEGDFYFSVETKLDAETFIRALSKEAGTFLEAPGAALTPAAPPFSGKYDYLLPEELLAKQYAANMLDPAALAKLR
jgi:hypothetical protein